MVHKITFQQSVEGFVLTKSVQLSQSTISDYKNAFRHFLGFGTIAETPLKDISKHTILEFFEYLRTTEIEINGRTRRAPRILSAKSRLNIHIALSSLWTWAIGEGLTDTHLLRSIPRPKAEKRAIHPFSRSELAAMLTACEHGREYQHIHSKTTTSNTRPTAARDQTIINVLVDTGIRASELCALKIGDLSPNRTLKIFGKGAKERILPLGRRTTKALWRYLLTRPDKTNKALPLFAQFDSETEHLTRRALHTLTKRIGVRAGVSGATPHRFRHTFAITALRNGMNIYALQRMLGHASLDMVKRYLEIVQADISTAHREASPVDNWRL